MLFLGFSLYIFKVFFNTITDLILVLHRLLLLLFKIHLDTLSTFLSKININLLTLTTVKL